MACYVRQPLCKSLQDVDINRHKNILPPEDIRQLNVKTGTGRDVIVCIRKAWWTDGVRILIKCEVIVTMVGHFGMLDVKSKTLCILSFIFMNVHVCICQFKGYRYLYRISQGCHILEKILKILEFNVYPWNPWKVLEFYLEFWNVGYFEKFPWKVLEFWKASLKSLNLLEVMHWGL